MTLNAEIAISAFRFLVAGLESGQRGRAAEGYRPKIRLGSASGRQRHTVPIHFGVLKSCGTGISRLVCDELPSASVQVIDTV